MGEWGKHLQRRGHELDLLLPINTNWDQPRKKEVNQHKTVPRTPQLPKSTQKDTMLDDIKNCWEFKKSKDGYITSIPVLPEIVHECDLFSFGPILYIIHYSFIVAMYKCYNILQKAKVVLR